MAIPLFAAIIAGACGVGSKYGDLNPELDGEFYIWSASAESPDDSTSGIRLTNIGDDVTRRTNGGYGTITDFLLGGDSADYEAYCEVTAGTLNVGSASVDTWLSLDVNREWYVQETGLGTETATLAITIRKAAIPSQDLSFSVLLEATVETP